MEKRMSNKLTEESKFKLFLIYCFEYYEESNAKLFNEIAEKKLDYPYKFQDHTPQENDEYLYKWKKRNGIRVGDFELPRKYEIDQYGTPIYIKRVRGSYHKCDFDDTDYEA